MMDTKFNHPGLYRMLSDVCNFASRLYGSPLARTFLFALSAFLILHPTWTVIRAFNSGWIMLSLPLIATFFSGLVGLRVAWKWGRYGPN